MGTSKADKKAKAEALLYILFLDLHYSIRDYEARVKEIQEDLKTAKARLKKAKVQLTNVEVNYKEVYGKEPTKLRR